MNKATRNVMAFLLMILMILFFVILFGVHSGWFENIGDGGIMSPPESLYTSNKNYIKIYLINWRFYDN